MENLTSIEFFKSPDGCVLYKRQGESVRELMEQDRDLVGALLDLIRTRYPEAFVALSDLYSRSERNRPYYEWRMASRFIRCNLGSYDTQTIDIDAEGRLHFEQMQCPLMGSGDCRYECVICRPKLNTGLTTRELELLPLLADGLQSWEIAERLSVSKNTVDRHRQNILAKLSLRSTTELSAWYHKEVRSEK
jgi:DNA-binding CsgD family transcriptional regulator